MRCLAVIVVVAGCGRVDFELRDDAAIGSGVASCALVPTPVSGTEYFVGPGGSDMAAGTTAATAWQTFAHAWTVLAPGDTLTLLDGTYHEALAPTISGAMGAPILVRAQNDGSAIVDGDAAREPCAFRASSPAFRTDLVIEGIACNNPMTATDAIIIQRADRIVMRRVTARANNVAAFQVYQSSNVLLEDIAGAGSVTDMISVESSSNVTVRRCFGHFTAGPQVYATIVTVFTASNVLVENCVATTEPAAGHNVEGFALTGQGGVASSNTFAGDVAIGPFSQGWISSDDPAMASTGNTVRDSVFVTAERPLYQRGDSGLQARRLTLATGTEQFYAYPNGTATVPIGFHLASSALVAGATGISYPVSSLITPADHHDNVFDAIATFYGGAAGPGANERSMALGYDTTSYGNGAYLIRPPELATAGEAGEPAGAEVLYRSVDGTLTTTPLWPWPLEGRIMAEQGVSVTWESGGGVWRAPPPVQCP